jgi:hypothetical protein
MPEYFSGYTGPREGQIVVYEDEENNGDEEFTVKWDKKRGYYFEDEYEDEARCIYWDVEHQKWWDWEYKDESRATYRMKDQDGADGKGGADMDES